MIDKFEMSRRNAFLIVCLMSVSKSAFRSREQKAGFVIGDGVHGANSAEFELQHHPSGQGYRAQFFRSGELAAEADFPPDVTLQEVRGLGDEWFAAFPLESA